LPRILRPRTHFTVQLNSIHRKADPCGPRARDSYRLHLIPMVLGNGKAAAGLDDEAGSSSAVLYKGKKAYKMIGVYLMGDVCRRLPQP